MINKRWLIVGIIAVGIGAMYYVNQNTYPTVWVASKSIPKGTMLKKEFFHMEKVKSKKGWMIDDDSYFNHTYAKEAINQDEYFSRNEVALKPLIEVQPGEVVVGIKASNKDEIVGWQLQRGDQVSIENYDREKKETFQDPLLSNVVIVALVNRDGLDVSDAKDSDRVNVEAITVKMSKEQAQKFDTYSRKGDIRLMKEPDSKGASKS